MTLEGISPEEHEHAWRPDAINEHLHALGAEPITEDQAAALKKCYEAAYRYYHGVGHGGYMGLSKVPGALIGRFERMNVGEANALLAIAGLFHDTVYKHVDVDPKNPKTAWAPDVHEKIGDFATYDPATVADKNTSITRLTETGRRDRVTRMVATMFGIDPDAENASIKVVDGGNEFDSALYAAKFLEVQDVGDETILKAVTMIAATIPFRPSREEEGYPYPDGFMGVLAERLRKIPLSDDGSERSWADVNDTMLLSVQLANRDILPFLLPNNIAGLVHGGRMVKKEEVPELRKETERIREMTMSQLAAAAKIMRSAAALYGMLADEGAVKAEYVPKLYVFRDEHGRPRKQDGFGDPVDDAYPPVHVYEAWVENVRENTRRGKLYFQAHEAGILTARALAAAVESTRDALVLDFVSADLWDLGIDEVYATLEAADPDAFVVSRLMTTGERQQRIDPVTPERSPIGGTLLAWMGSGRMEELSQFIQDVYKEHKESNPDPFGDQTIARAFLHKVAGKLPGGKEQLRLIFAQLAQIANIRKNLSRAALLSNVSL